MRCIEGEIVEYELEMESDFLIWQLQLLWIPDITLVAIASHNILSMWSCRWILAFFGVML